MQLPEWQQKAFYGIVGVPEISSVLSGEECFHFRVSDPIIRRNETSRSFTLWFLAGFAMSTSTDRSKLLLERQESPPPKAALCEVLMGTDISIWGHSVAPKSCACLCVCWLRSDKTIRKGMELAWLVSQRVLCQVFHVFFPHPVTHSVEIQAPKPCARSLWPFHWVQLKSIFLPCEHSKGLFVVLVLQRKPPSALDFSVWWHADLLLPRPEN